ncbi:MAG: Protein-L-isoaspartate O-methyltransferase [Microgenomates bacterium 39_7]|nr:MAG: Protein-L-isoaspartate O-methyltransferase [Microgenomates bacterium 39_7]
MLFTASRKKMVKTQLESRDIDDPAVIEAFMKVPREKFVPEKLKDMAYSDRPLPIGEGQTISQPYIVAKMCQILELEGSEKVLDVGTGSGYQAAILSHLAKKVISLEVVKNLAERAKEILQELNYDNVEVYHQDAKKGLKSKAPFGAIICAAAADNIPASWKEQLSVGGKIVLPLRTTKGQRLVKIIKTSQGFKRKEFDPVTFVPLV